MGVSAQEPGLSRVRLKSPQHSSMLSSPTESDGTEFFDAQEEILWSPEPPSKLPPLPVHRESKAQQGQIADYDRKPQAADGGHSADHKRTMVKSIWSPVPIQVGHLSIYLLLSIQGIAPHLPRVLRAYHLELHHRITSYIRTAFVRLYPWYKAGGFAAS